MTIDLVAMVFDQDEDASKAKWVLDTLHKTRALGLENAVVVERDTAGKAFVQKYKRLPAGEPVLDDTFLILFANAIFTGIATERERDLVIAELDEVFLEEIDTAWQSSNSALLIFSSRKSLVDLRRLLNYLSEYRGTLFQTTIPEQIVESILELSGSG